MNRFILFLLLVLMSCNKKIVPVTEHIYKPASSLKKNDILKIKVFNNDTLNNEIKITGFGYDIYRNNTLYIHQPNIPAVAGTEGFSTAQNAYKAAMLVAYKIQNNILPPSVSTYELDSIGVK